MGRNPEIPLIPFSSVVTSSDLHQEEQRGTSDAAIYFIATRQLPMDRESVDDISQWVLEHAEEFPKYRPQWAKLLHEKGTRAQKREWVKMAILHDEKQTGKKGIGSIASSPSKEEKNQFGDELLAQGSAEDKTKWSRLMATNGTEKDKNRWSKLLIQEGTTKDKEMWGVALMESGAPRDRKRWSALVAVNGTPDDKLNWHLLVEADPKAAVDWVKKAVKPEAVHNAKLTR